MLGRNNIMFQLENISIVVHGRNYVIAKGPQDYVVLAPAKLKEELEMIITRVKAKNGPTGGK